ncbi:hypothetical protein MmiHf6_14740 [Methanimicrococcus hongohii]|uniref:Uncharacterized protein n=1 Tax=Methanimicrococcus hongohii TaxID=3028295 RepID=A0AA96V1I6_9EURY|nr:hypothetical protein [Methanimicrococcus sp. Hf6]WNY24145.1 hypothetical protein MmiHf6_14740 [Methanimicrococcus sp. Hf6]
MNYNQKTMSSIFLFSLLVVLSFAAFYFFGPVLTPETMYRTGVALLAPALIVFAFITFDFSKIGSLICVFFAALLYIMYLFGADWNLWLQSGIFIFSATYAVMFAYYKLKAEELALAELAEEPSEPTIEINVEENYNI